MEKKEERNWQKAAFNGGERGLEAGDQPDFRRAVTTGRRLLSCHQKLSGGRSSADGARPAPYPHIYFVPPSQVQARCITLCDYPVRPARPVPARRARARTWYELLARWGPHKPGWGSASEAALLLQKRRSRDQHVPVWCIQTCAKATRETTENKQAKVLPTSM